MNLEDHPTVCRLSKHIGEGTNQQPGDAVLDAAWLPRLALDLGADDAGLVEIVRPALTEQDKAEGYILTCQAKIRGEVKVDG